MLLVNDGLEMACFIGQFDCARRVVHQSLNTQPNVVVFNHALFHCEYLAVEIHFETYHFHVFAVFWPVGTVQLHISYCKVKLLQVPLLLIFLLLL